MIQKILLGMMKIPVILFYSMRNNPYYCSVINKSNAL